MKTEMSILSTLCIFLLCTTQCNGDLAFARSIANLFTGIATEGEFPELYENIYPGDGAALPTFDQREVELAPVVDTTSGPVQGAKIPEGYAFYSVPFAQPPVGEMRYQPPLPITEPLDLINATDIDGLVCYQSEKECVNGVCIHNVNEDCLVMNIHVPSIVDLSKPTSSLPVLLWFYGGGFFTGGGTIPEFEGRWLSNTTQTIVVTPNYRLAAFGYLVHGEGETAFKGNQGIKDQQLAMQWVQDNIAHFGGDPSRVTIFGNSAGAQSVMLHLVSDVSEPLFHRAIMQSNPAVFQYQTPEEALNVTDRLLRRLKCPRDSLEEERQCLLNQTAKAINRALPAVMALSLIEDQDVYSTVEAFRPVLDGIEFKEQPFVMFRDGTWQTDKDVIIGTNIEELEMIQYYIPEAVPINKNMFELVNNIVMGPTLGPIVSELYEGMVEPNTTDYKPILGVEAGHMFFICPSRLLARFASNTASASSKVYLYSNAHPMDGENCTDLVDREGMCGLAFHGVEPPFIFRSGPGYGFEFTDNDTKVSNEFDSYWVNFGESGNPSNGGLAELGDFTTWPEYVSDDVTMTSYDSHNYKSDYNYKFREGSQRKNKYAKRNRNEVKNLAQDTQKVTVPAWSNIRIQPPNSVLENGYMEEICDFWDSLNFYVDVEAPSTEEPPTEVTPAQTTTPQPIESTTVLNEIKTTTSGSTSYKSIFFLCLCFSLLAALINEI